MRGLTVEMYSSFTSPPTLSSFDYSWAHFVVGILWNLLGRLTPILLGSLLGGWLTICARGHLGRHLSPKLLGRTCCCKALFVASVGYFIWDQLFIVLLMNRLPCFFGLVGTVGNLKGLWCKLSAKNEVAAAGFHCFLLVFMTVIKSIWTIHPLATPHGWWQRMDG